MRIFRDKQKLAEMLELLPTHSDQELAIKYNCHRTSIIFWRRKTNGIIIKRPRAPRCIIQPQPIKPLTHLYDVFIFKDKINQGQDYKNYLQEYEQREKRRKYAGRRSLQAIGANRQ